MKLSEKKNDLIPGLTEHEWQFLQKMYTFLHTEAIPKGLGASSDEKAWAPILKDGMSYHMNSVSDFLLYLCVPAMPLTMCTSMCVFVRVCFLVRLVS